MENDGIMSKVGNRYKILLNKKDRKALRRLDDLEDQIPSYNTDIKANEDTDNIKP